MVPCPTACANIGVMFHCHGFLCLQVAESKISIKDAQADAISVLKDGCAEPFSATVARLGAFGRHPGNCARDFRRSVLAKSVQMLPTYSAELPFMNPESNTVVFCDQCLVLPHEYLHYLHKWPEEFCRRLFGSSRGREDCRKYWEKAHTSSWFAEHPAKTQIDADPLSVVPARLYGDDAAYQKKRSALVLTWSSLLNRLPSMESRFVITVLPLISAVEATKQHIYKIIAWSFEQMLRGVFPTCDHTGTPWPKTSWRSRLAGA